MRRKYKYFVFYEYKKSVNDEIQLFDSCELILDFKIKSYFDVMRAGLRLLDEKRTGIKILNYIKLK